MRSARRIARVVVLASLLSPTWLAGQQDTTDYPPAGFGTLRQDAISIGLRTTEFEIQIIPLDERVIRLLSPDTYRSLHRLKTTRANQLEDIASRYGLRQPKVFLVRFFGLQPSVRFEPEFLTITSQNRLFRVLEIIPMSPLWSDSNISILSKFIKLYLFPLVKRHLTD